MCTVKEIAAETGIHPDLMGFRGLLEECQEYRGVIQPLILEGSKVCRILVFRPCSSLSATDTAVHSVKISYFRAERWDSALQISFKMRVRSHRMISGTVEEASKKMEFQ